MRIFNKPNSPQALEILAKSRERRENLSLLKPVVEEGIKRCVWCLDELPKGCRKYCSTLCSDSAFAHFNPQSKAGLQYLLVLQDFRCNQCGFDYRPFLEMLFEREITQDSLVEYSYEFNNLSYLMRREGFEEFLPEVDHILAIGLGGESLGLDNHQVLCRECHKIKTVEDLNKMR